MKIAIIGTAGRDKTKRMTFHTWMWMVHKAKRLMPTAAASQIHLVSGGAAWADHLAVQLFLDGSASELTLHLPAPLGNDGYFQGGKGTAGGVANYYHSKFSLIAGINSRQDILIAAQEPGCHGSVQPIMNGYGSLFARNKLIVEELDPATDRMLAFTFGEGSEPADGGTKNTWDMFHGNKHHITIPEI